jgi:hypothetical protein
MRSSNLLAKRHTKTLTVTQCLIRIETQSMQPSFTGIDRPSYAVLGQPDPALVSPRTYIRIQMYTISRSLARTYPKRPDFLQPCRLSDQRLLPAAHSPLWPAATQICAHRCSITNNCSVLAWHSPRDHGSPGQFVFASSTSPNNM